MFRFQLSGEDWEDHKGDKNGTSACAEERTQESNNNMPCLLLLCHLRTSVNAEESAAQVQSIVNLGSGCAVNLSRVTEPQLYCI